MEKEEHEENPNAYSRVGDVEDRTEKEEWLTPDKGQPRGEHALDEREVEHVDDAAVKPLAIASLCGEKLRHLPPRRAEDDAIEDGVDDVAHSSRQDQRHADHEPPPPLAAAETDKPPADEANGDNPENRQGQLAPTRARKLHPESHPVVLDEMEAKPVAEDADLLTERKVGLDPKLHKLVNNQDCRHHGHGHLSVRCHSRKKFFSVTKEFLVSMTPEDAPANAALRRKDALSVRPCHACANATPRLCPSAWPRC